MTNKFVSFLKKAGQILAAGAEVAIETIPMLAPFTPLLPSKVQGTVSTVEATAQNDATWLLQSITGIETAGAAIGTPGLTGAQKAQMAGAAIAPAFLAAMNIAGKKAADPAKANAALVTIAGGVADFMNAYSGDPLPNPPAVPAPAPPAAA